MVVSEGSKRADQHPLMHAILDSAPQGFSVWGLDLTLVVCNSAYLGIYGFSPAEVGPGTSLRTVGRLSVGMGNHPDSSADEMYERYLERLAEARETGLPVRVEKAIKGRVVAATHSFIDEVGWLVMHEDITEQTEQKWLKELTEKSLDAQSRRFNAAIDNMSHGLSIFDADMRIVVRNARYLEIYNLTSSMVGPGTTMLSIAQMRRDRGTAPSDMPDFIDYIANSTGPTERYVETSKLENGRSIQVTRSPIEGGGFVAVHQDITAEIDRLEALTSSHQEIAVQKLRFEAALANISHGLSMYDADGRLVICNERYRQIYRAPESVVRPGMRYDDLVARRDAPDGFKRIPKSDEFIAAVLGELSSENETIEAFRMGDGRTVSIRQSPVADGGFVRTHQDITTQVERFETLRRAERAAARQNRILTIQNERFDAAINNMSQGLCMFDKRERLVVANDRYTQLYNLPPELVKPGTPLRKIIEYRVAHGMAPKHSRASFYDTRMRLVNQEREAKDEIEHEDGRTIFIHHRPMRGGGWVATHEDVTEQRLIEARVRHLARHDALTDLPNRTYLHEQSDRVATRIERLESVAILCVDLDHFKAVNDTLGHAIGDQVLVEVARRLRESSSAEDVIVRLGGDEFALIVQSVSGAPEVSNLAARIVRSISRRMEIEEHHINIGASIGIAVAPTDGYNMETLLKNADTALYRAKSEGRGDYHFFERGMDDALQHRRMLEQGLKIALSRGEFRLMYQPLLDLSTNKICCFEALLRWDHPEHGTISPAEFIPVAEETGIISTIGEWVLQQACKAASEWPEDVRVAVNLSPAQFRQRGLVDQVVRAMAQAGLRTSRLELEVTESLLLADTDITLETLHQLRALGVRISMDDFGTGYSSLSYLRSFPFDKIKIDRTFVAGLKPGDESTAIIKAVVGLGHSLGMSTTAEGIETEAQLEAVRAQGCNEVQGFLFSPPLPPSGVAALLGAGDRFAQTLRKHG